MGTGTVVGTGNMTVTPVTGSLPTMFTPTPTPEPTIAPGTIGEDSCLECTLFLIFSPFWSLDSLDDTREDYSAQPGKCHRVDA